MEFHRLLAQTMRNKGTPARFIILDSMHQKKKKNSTVDIIRSFSSHFPINNHTHKKRIFEWIELHA